MSTMSKAGDWGFKALVGGLSLATVYLTATFSVNVYRGFAWHKAQAVWPWCEVMFSCQEVNGREATHNQPGLSGSLAEDGTD